MRTPATIMIACYLWLVGATMLLFASMLQAGSPWQWWAGLYGGGLVTAFIGWGQWSGSRWSVAAVVLWSLAALAIQWKLAVAMAWLFPIDAENAVPAGINGSLALVHVIIIMTNLHPSAWKASGPAPPASSASSAVTKAKPGQAPL